MSLALKAGMIPHVPTLPPGRRSRPWSPSLAGPYQLPRVVQERLTVALSGFRNRDAALALSVFVARFWSLPARLALPFPIDRRALTDHAALDLTEARVRGAIAALEAVGFIERDLAPRGSPYKATEHGLRRKPVLWRFSSEYGVAFAKANARSRADRGVPTPDRRSISMLGRSMSLWTQVAQKEIPAESEVLMGDQREKELLDPGLAAALERLGRAAGKEWAGPARQDGPGVRLLGAGRRSRERWTVAPENG